MSEHGYGAPSEILKFPECHVQYYKPGSPAVWVVSEYYEPAGVSIFPPGGLGFNLREAMAVLDPDDASTLPHRHSGADFDALWLDHRARALRRHASRLLQPTPEFLDTIRKRRS